MFKLRNCTILCTKWAHFKFDACYRLFFSWLWYQDSGNTLAFFSLWTLKSIKVNFNSENKTSLIIEEVYSSQTIHGLHLNWIFFIHLKSRHKNECHVFDPCVLMNVFLFSETTHLLRDISSRHMLPAHFKPNLKCYSKHSVSNKHNVTLSNIHYI